MTAIIVSIAVERFGDEEKGPRTPYIPVQWRVAEGVWIPKDDNPTQIHQFCIISLFVCRGKDIFQLSNRLCAYLAKNTYIDTSVQKGGISGMPGCLEHNGVVNQLIR
ncbi:UDP-N-acetylmuramoyl-L-alanyl-D-glutamate--26-diaminopimelate ligase [Dissostichus eleginoides]|uniref:UDP-N-acetylmuramoyl-L-alanyl-D-glutamate--26-diaminopimelate ligase n=1 Tax=Dissostichus eleginoides TaxID=100907 RepID=A0AAD9CLN5_DISEL|nr:UDP-N-acetylmuramoyl-L-alanyl-D-glutamate--26-diaminopimelate ligase [Dissostichus eleginoides]